MAAPDDGTDRDHIYLVVEGYYQNAQRYAEDKESAIEYIHGEMRRVLNAEDIPGIPDYNIRRLNHVDFDRSGETEPD